VKLAVEPDKLGRLASVLEHELGHDLAFAVEAAKIAVNSGSDADIGLKVVQKGLSAVLTQVDLWTGLQDQATRIAEAAQVTLDMADIPATEIGSVILVGGSSLMRVVESALRGLCPEATVERGDAFTAIADGLSLAAARPFDSHPI